MFLLCCTRTRCAVRTRRPCWCPGRSYSFIRLRTISAMDSDVSGPQPGFGTLYVRCLTVAGYFVLAAYVFLIRKRINLKLVRSRICKLLKLGTLRETEELDSAELRLSRPVIPRLIRWLRPSQPTAISRVIGLPRAPAVVFPWRPIAPLPVG